MGASDLALRSAGLANIHRLAPHLVGDLPLSPAELPPPVLRLPKKLKQLFVPTKAPDGKRVRYRVAKGGRGGAKSWGFAKMLLAMGAERQLRILCARELQVSITESVHKLLSDQIAADLQYLFARLQDCVWSVREDAAIAVGGDQSTKFAVCQQIWSCELDEQLKDAIVGKSE